MNKVDKYVRFMVDNGLIFEINRKVLHPLGLSLDIGIHPDNSKWLAIKGLLSVDDDDDEGFIFDGETYTVGAERYNMYLVKEGNKKLNDRVNSIGYIVQEMPAASIIDYHFNGYKDSAGRSLHDCLAFSTGQKENIHDYIQWMFPNRNSSSVNPDTPTLTDENIERFDSVTHATKLYNFFKDFLESEYHDEIFSNLANHNHLRITRVITFFVETGHHNIAEDLCNYCLSSAGEDLILAISYWKEALNGKDI